MKDSAEQFKELLKIISHLRDPEKGCPWDLKQTHASLKPYLIEESYEVLDAIDHGIDDLPEELGDVLLQVLLHSQIGKDSGAFSIDEVMEILSKKLIERHPHVFGSVKVDSAEQVSANWNAIKESKKTDQGKLESVPRTLPSLMQAHELGKRAAEVGFDWKSAEDVTGKIREELEEFLEAHQNSMSTTAEELGDLLFALSQFARKLKIDPEEALRQTNRKFRERFAKMEKMSKEPLAELSLEELEGLWERSKLK